MTAVGTSTHGVRIPPTASPCSSAWKPVPSSSTSSRGCHRGRFAPLGPTHQVGQRGLGDVVLLGAGVDGGVRVPDHEVGSRAEQFGQALGAQCPIVVASRADGVGVGVCRTCHLPDPDLLGVRLRGEATAQEDDVGFALQDQHGHPRVVTNALALGGDGTSGRLNSLTSCRGNEDAVDGHADARPSVHEEAIEDPCVVIDGVDVGHQACGGLRLARRDHPLGHQSSEGVLVARHRRATTRPA